jgi:hypothetical protein
VETHRDTFGVAPLLAAIGEPVSTFYDRTSRTPSARAVADTAVAERIEAIRERSRRTYGAPRIHAMLAREGIRVGRKRVERLMRQLGIQGAHLHKHWKNHPTAPRCGGRRPHPTLADADVEVLEVDRPDRTDRRRRDKSDTLDAIAAAQAALAGRRASIPKSRDGRVESLRVLKLTRATAVRARTKALQLLRHPKRVS